MPNQPPFARLATVLFVRRALFCLLAVLLATFPARAEQRVRVGVYENSPKIATSESGKPEGIFVDLIEAIAEKEGWVLEYVPGTWSDGLERLEAGQIDLMPDVAHNSERERIYAFHREPVLSGWNQVYVRRGSGIRSLPDLDGRRVAVLEGSTQEELFRTMVSGFALNVELLALPDFATAFRAVADGKADAVLTNRFYGARNAGKFGLEDTAIIFAPSRLHFAAPKKGDLALLAAIDRHLKAFKQDSSSTYYQSLRRWTSDEMKPAMPRWLNYAALGIAALLLASLLWGVTLRRTAVRLRESEQHQRDLAAKLEQSMADLAQTTRFLDALVDHISSPIFYKGPDLRFRGCNEAYERAFGVTRADFIGKTVLDLEYLPEADRRAYQAEDAAVLAAGTTLRREAVIPFVDGREHQTLYSVSGFRDVHGQPGGLVGIIVDVTPLKEAEAALRAANEEQVAIFDAANFGIALIRNRTIQRCNRQLEALFGYAPGELSGQPTRVWYGSEEDYQQGCDPTYLETARGEVHHREQQLLHKDGSLFWCRMMARTLDPADFTKGIVCVVEDVTEVRAAAQALLEAKHAAEAADRLKSAFLATMSHELRTPLNSIIGFTGILLQELAGPLNAEQKKQLGMVQNSARHLLALINDVLDISKIEAGELTVATEPFDLAASITNVTGIVGPLAQKKGLTLEIQIHADAGEVVGDMRRVEQILFNLLSNAIKFTETGAITLAVEPVADFRPAPDALPHPAVRLQVADTGIGIKPEDMKLLFQPFRQVDSAMTRKHEGTGLGLAICRRLAALMGGSIEAESRFGEGSRFTLILPLGMEKPGESK